MYAFAPTMYAFDKTYTKALITRTRWRHDCLQHSTAIWSPSSSSQSPSTSFISHIGGTECTVQRAGQTNAVMPARYNDAAINCFGTLAAVHELIQELLHLIFALAVHKLSEAQEGHLLSNEKVAANQLCRHIKRCSFFSTNSSNRWIRSIAACILVHRSKSLQYHWRAIIELHGSKSLQYHAIARQSHCCAMTLLSFPSPFCHETLCLLLLFTMKDNTILARASWIFINTC